KGNLKSSPHSTTPLYRLAIKSDICRRQEFSMYSILYYLNECSRLQIRTLHFLYWSSLHEIPISQYFLLLLNPPNLTPYRHSTLKKPHPIPAVKSRKQVQIHSHFLTEVE